MQSIQKSFISLLLDNAEIYVNIFPLEYEFNTNVITNMKGLEMIQINSLTRPNTKLNILIRKIFNHMFYN